MQDVSIYLDDQKCIIHGNNDILIVGAVTHHEDDQYVVDTQSCTITLHGYHVDNTMIFVPHNEQGPAWIHHDKKYNTQDSHNFFIHGKKVTMEDITNDPTLKLLVELKWGHLRLDTFRDNVYV